MNHKDTIDYWQNKYKDFQFLSNIKSGKEADVLKVTVNEEFEPIIFYSGIIVHG